MSLRVIASTVCALCMFAYGLPSVLSVFGISIPNVTSMIPSIIGLLIVMLSSLWLCIDGWGEEHFLKTISLTVAMLLAVYFAANVITLLGIFAVPVPGFVEVVKSWLYVAAGVLLLIGIFAYE